jgi:hypothetical protein
VIKTYNKSSPYLHHQIFQYLKDLNDRLVQLGVTFTGSVDNSNWLAKMQSGLLDAFDRGLSKVIGVDDTPNTASAIGTPAMARLQDGAKDFKKSNSFTEGNQKSGVPLASTYSFSFSNSALQDTGGNSYASSTYQPYGSHNSLINNDGQGSYNQKEYSYDQSSTSSNDHTSTTYSQSGKKSTYNQGNNSYTQGDNNYSQGPHVYNQDGYNQGSTYQSYNYQNDTQFGNNSVYTPTGTNDSYSDYNAGYNNYDPSSTNYVSSGGGYEPYSNSTYQSNETYGDQGSYQPYEFTESSEAAPTQPSQSEAAEAFDDDLGLGNSSIRKTKKEEKVEEEAPKEEPKRSSSYFSLLTRWLPSSGSSTPKEQPKKAFKANLGEENQMVFDPETKRWVMKVK